MIKNPTKIEETILAEETHTVQKMLLKRKRKFFMQSRGSFSVKVMQPIKFALEETLFVFHPQFHKLQHLQTPGVIYRHIFHSRGV